MINRIIPDYKKIREEFADFGMKLISSDELLIQDKQSFFDKAKWQSTGTLPLGGLTVADTWGGRNYTAAQTCAAYEGFGFGCLNNGIAFSIGAHFLGSVIPLSIHGSDFLKTSYLSQLATGQLIAANAITEHNAGSDVFNMEGLAVRKTNGYEITAQKIYITNAPVADVLVVYVMTDKEKGFFGGVSAFIIPADRAGVEVSEVKDKMGLKTCHMAHVSFNSVFVEESLRLGEEGSGSSMFSESMVWERTVLAALHIGQLERVYRKALSFCKKRKVGGKKILGFQNIAHTLAEVQTVINAGRLLVYDAALAIDEKASNALVKSSMAKLFVSERGVEAVKSIQTLYGAAGYLMENEVEREYRDLYASLIYSGTTDIQKNIITGHS